MLYVWFHEDSFVGGGERVEAHLRYKGALWGVRGRVQSRTVSQANRLIGFRATVDSTFPIS